MSWLLVKHADGSARVQTVRREQNSKMYDLLRVFKDLTGYGVLCNTSLNFKGRGFINRISDLEEYVIDRRLTGFVIHDSLYLLRSNKSYYDADIPPPSDLAPFPQGPTRP